jgi:molecular chaperone GrpE
MNEEQEPAVEERLQEQLLRLRADFDNYRRRTSHHFSRLANQAKVEFIKRLLPVADDLDRAFGALGPEDSPARKGFEMISQKFFSLLRAEGVERIGAPGEDFNPEIHEAVSTQEDEDGQEGKVREVLQSGYRMGEVILRPAKVLVAVGREG